MEGATLWSDPAHRPTLIGRIDLSRHQHQLRDSLLNLSTIHREGLDTRQPQPWSKIANLPSQESAVE
jgi:hypothetical protein